ncbi:sensor histidine kinase [Clostridium sp. 19966]|uniref:sensor histidine kinase n=1 Tax=Clostridium sp. 19966 TaxID=2768166 RepID=UPI0028E08D74|nr:sensor histidine kinase [Clostridium sp. 19966]MDT8718903.1 sensor histidine kinase [Clostridium sp. 19966]
MENKFSDLHTLTICRYATYAAIFILSIMRMDNNLYRQVLFCFLFLIILLISSVRILYTIPKIKWFITSVIIEAILIAILSWIFDSFIFVCAYVTIVDIFLFLETKPGIILSVCVYLSMFPSCFTLEHSSSIKEALQNYIMDVVSISFFAVCAYILKREKELKYTLQSLNEELRLSKEELEAANKKLSDYASKVEEISILNERNRLAGEIHDNIGHRLTGLIMEMDICSKLLEKDISKTKAELSKASDLARDTLAEVRKSVKKIMPSSSDETSGINSMKELIKNFEKNTRILVKFNVSESRYKLSPTVEVTLYRAIQEALTNSAKHGDVTDIAIDLVFKNKKVYLSIADNGKGCCSLIKGVGLKSMEERINMLGGTIAFKNVNGFIIHIEIPVEV